MAGFPINGSMPSDALTLLDLRSPGICRTEAEPRGIRKNRHRDDCRILILTALDDDINCVVVSDVSQYFVIQITALHGIVAQSILPAECVLAKRASVIESKWE
jgi:hypothetical protein